MLRMPAKVLRYSGNATPSAMSAIFGVSPIPNQMMNSGIRPNSGSVRSICIGGSTASSPTRLRPATTDSASPIEAPTTKPTSTRCTETRVAAPSVPSATRPPAAVAICSGEAIFSSGSTPLLLSACHRQSSSTGLTQRRSQDSRDSRAVRRRPGTRSRAGPGGRASSSCCVGTRVVMSSQRGELIRLSQVRHMTM